MVATSKKDEHRHRLTVGVHRTAVHPGPEILLAGRRRLENLVFAWEGQGPEELRSEIPSLSMFPYLIKPNL